MELLLLTFDVADMKAYFSQEKRSGHEGYRLIPKVDTEHDGNEINDLYQSLKEELDHVMPLYHFFPVNISTSIQRCFNVVSTLINVEITLIRCLK